MKKLMLAVPLAFLLAACGGHVVVLKSGQSLETSKAPELDAKTGFYRVETKDGKKMQVNKDEILMIRDK